MNRLLFVIGSLCLCVFADLPPYTGPYGVGTIDVEVDVEQRNISDTTYKSTGQPVFQLETVLFTLYYPAAKGVNTSSTPHPWIPRPIDLVGQGLSAYLKSINSSVSSDAINAGLMLLAGGINIPAVVDAPVLGANSIGNLTALVFSHGDAALSNWYSSYCGELASRGLVIVAVVHRDGSSAATVINKSDGTTRNVTYITLDEVSPSINASVLIQQQRDFRQAEVEEVVKALKNITNGGGESVYNANSRKEGKSLVDWSGRLDLSKLLVGGHSFGATSAIQTLKGAPNSTIPAHGAIVLDPGKQSGPLNTDINVPILLTDSEQWSSQPFDFYGRQHFDVVKDLAQGDLNKTGASWFMTLMGTSHNTVTDVSLVGGAITSGFANTGTSFNATLNANTSLAQYVAASTEFIAYLHNGTKTDILAAPVTYPEFNKPNNTALDNTADSVKKYWRIHVAPNVSGGANGTGGSGGNGGSSGGSGGGSGGTGGNGGQTGSASGVYSSVQMLFVSLITVFVLLHGV